MPHLIQGGVGQHLLQGPHRQGLLQNEAADREVWRDILKYTTKLSHLVTNAATRDACVPAVYLSVRGGLQETQAVPKPFAGQTHFDLLFENGGGALEHHMVSLRREKGGKRRSV